jgi:NADH-quinone oxidoreductase subunit C
VNVGERLVGLLDRGEASESGGGKFARATVDVPAESWAEAIATARDELGCDFFDWLSAVDELPGGFMVVAHLWSTVQKHGVLIRAELPRSAPAIETITHIFPGAAWHERETHEMFGIGFTGHEAMSPLLLPPEFEGHPLRKEFVLASRVAKPWPGAKEPGESEHTASKRAPVRPPGVPDPAEWPGGRS